MLSVKNLYTHTNAQRHTRTSILIPRVQVHYHLSSHPQPRPILTRLSLILSLLFRCFLSIVTAKRSACTRARITLANVVLVLSLREKHSCADARRLEKSPRACSAMPLHAARCRDIHASTQRMHRRTKYWHANKMLSHTYAY